MRSAKMSAVPQVFWITPLGWYHLLLFGILLPWMAWRSQQKLAMRPLPPRARHFVSTSITILLFAAFSTWTARGHSLALFPPRLPRLTGIVAGVVMLILAVIGMRPRWRRAVERRARIAYLFMPRTAKERLLWGLLAASAAIGEEITWRGVQPALASFVVHNTLLGAVLTAISFGFAHMLQGWRSSAIIVLFALGFQMTVWLSGSLYVAMLVHFLYDLTAGFTYGRFGRELGYPMNAMLPSVPSAPIETSAT